MKEDDQPSAHEANVRHLSGLLQRVSDPVERMYIIKALNEADRLLRKTNVRKESLTCAGRSQNRDNDTPVSKHQAARVTEAEQLVLVRIPRLSTWRRMRHSMGFHGRWLKADAHTKSCALCGYIRMRDANGAWVRPSEP